MAGELLSSDAAPEYAHGERGILAAYSQALPQPLKGQLQEYGFAIAEAMV